MIYPYRIKGLVKVVEARPTQAPISRLTEALGCRRCAFYATSGLWQAEAVTVPPPEADDLISSTLLWLLRGGFNLDTYTTLALLDGLMQNDRWLMALATVSDAYAFAELLIEANIFMESARHAHGQSTPEISDRLRRTTDPSICKVINDWVRPAIPLMTPPGEFALARLFFGDAWCDLLLDGVAAGDICSVIREWSPAFLPGAVAESLGSQRHTAAVSLASIRSASRRISAARSTSPGLSRRTLDRAPRQTAGTGM